MSEPSTTPARPPHVTIASGIVVVGSLFVVLEMWERISGLESLDTRAAMARYLAGSRLGSSGLDLDQLTMIVRVAAMAAAACATAMLILGWHVSRRSRSARLALSVLAGVLLVSGLVSDWFVESIGGTFWAGGIAAAVLTLWLGPARIWFSDSPAPAATTRNQAAARPTTPPAATPPPPRYDAPQPPRHDAPPPQTREQPPPMSQQWPPPSAWAPPPNSAYGEPYRRPQILSQRPPALLWACILTWFFTGLAVVVMVVSIVTLAQNAQPVLDEAYRQNPELSDQFSQHDVLVMLYGVIALVLACSIAAGAFATVLYRGHRWAWVALLVATSASTLFFLIGAFGSPVGLVPLAASAVTFVCLVRPEVRAWLVSRSGQRPPVGSAPPR